MTFLPTIHGHTVFAPDLRPGSVVLDLGANRGSFAHAILAAFSELAVYAVEANPAMVTRIPAHPNLETMELAVAPTSGEMLFHISPNDEESSLLTTGPAIHVRAIALANLLDTIPAPTLIKFDIEGAEIGVLEATPDAVLQQIPQLTVEFHDFLDLTPEAQVLATVDRLQQLGFFPIKMWREAWGDTLFVNRKLSSASLAQLLAGRYITRNWRGARRVAGKVWEWSIALPRGS